MQISEEQSDGVIIVSLNGRLDQSTSAQVEQRLLEIIGDQPVRLLLDCSRLTYVSSIGLRVFVLVSQRLSAVRGQLAFCALTEPICRVFTLVGITAWGKVYATREAAAMAWA